MKEKTKNKLKKSSIMLFSFSCLALMGTTLAIDKQKNVKQENLIVEKVEQREELKKQPNRAVMPADNNTLTIKGSYSVEDFLRVTQNLTEFNLATAPNTTETYTISGFEYTYTSRGQTLTGTEIKISHYNPHTDISNALKFQYVTTYNDNICDIDLSTNTYINDANDVETTMTTYNQNFYNLINNIQPTPEQPGMGEQIIDSVESGLGLISTLGSEFLAGFSALFWNATNQELTSFAIFSLVFLGIAITFSIIKLVLNIIRSNTGA